MKISGINVNKEIYASKCPQKLGIKTYSSCDKVSFGCDGGIKIIYGLDLLEKIVFKELLGDSGSLVKEHFLPTAERSLMRFLDLQVNERNELAVLFNVERDHDLGILLYSVGSVYAKRFVRNNERVFSVYKAFLENGLSQKGQVAAKNEIEYEYRKVLNETIDESSKEKLTPLILAHINDFQKAKFYLHSSLKTLMDGFELKHGNNTSGQLVLRKKAYKSLLEMYETVQDKEKDRIRPLLAYVDDQYSKDLRQVTRGLNKIFGGELYDTDFKKEYLSLLELPWYYCYILSIKSGISSIIPKALRS